MVLMFRETSTRTGMAARYSRVDSNCGDCLVTLGYPVDMGRGRLYRHAPWCARQTLHGGSDGGRCVGCAVRTGRCPIYPQPRRSRPPGLRRQYSDNTRIPNTVVHSMGLVLMVHHAVTICCAPWCVRQLVTRCTHPPTPALCSQPVDSSNYCIHNNPREVRIRPGQGHWQHC